MTWNEYWQLVRLLLKVALLTLPVVGLVIVIMVISDGAWWGPLTTFLVVILGTPAVLSLIDKWNWE